MLKLQHSIRKQTLHIVTDSEAVALALQPRVGDINRRSFLPLIERLFNEFSVPGRQIKIARLDVDLGDLPFDRFAEVAAERFDQELRRVLKEALREQDENPTINHRSLAEQNSHLELLEHYLLQGTLPFWAPPAETFTFEELLLKLAADDPAGLVAMIKKHGRQKRALERLVLQLGEATLQGLVKLLEPEHAALIIAYLTDLRKIHSIEPIIQVSDKKLSHILWMLVLSYLVTEPGSQFNRKSFVKRLLQGVARSEGLEYTQILAMVHLGLQETRKSHPCRSSLPEVISELTHELNLDTGQQRWLGEDRFDAGDRLSEALDGLDFYLTTEGQTARNAWLDQTDRRGLLRYLTAHDASRTRQLIIGLAGRSKAGLPSLIHRLLQAFAPEDLLAVLAYGEKEFIATLVTVVISEGGEAGRTGRARPDALDGALWQTAFEYLLSEPSGRWERRTIVRQVVEAGAERLGVSRGSLAGRLARALEGRAGTVEASLAQSLDTLERVLDHRPGPALPAQLFFARYDQVEVLRYYLRNGILPWSALIRDPDLTVERALACLPELSRSLLLTVFARDHSGQQPRFLLRALRVMPEECLARFLLHLYPQLSKADSPFNLALLACAAKTEDKHAFYARLIASTLNGDSLDLEELAAPALVQPKVIEPLLPADPAGWDASALKSVIVNRLRFGETFTVGECTLAALLHALVATYPEDARNLCRALRNAPLLVADLIKNCSTTVFDHLLELLCPGESATLSALLRSLATIPVTYLSYSEESRRQAIFDEVIRLEEGRSLADGFLFERVIRRLFATPLQDEVRQLLLRVIAAWRTSGELPIGHVTAFETTIKRAAPEPAPSARSPIPRDEILAILGGGSLEVNVPDNSQKIVGPRRQQVSEDALRHTLITTIETHPEEIYSFAIRFVEDPLRREHWAETLPESALARLTYLLEPRMHRTLLDTAEVLAGAWFATAPLAGVALAGRKFFWIFLLDFLALTTPASRSVERLVAFFVEFTATRYQAAAPDRLHLGAEMLEHVGRLARDEGRANLDAVLQRHRSHLLSSWERFSSPVVTPTVNVKSESGPGVDEGWRARQDRGRMAFSMPVEQDDDLGVDQIYIDNAGLVLTGPFLPHLFETLHLIDSGDEAHPRLRGQEAISRAVHLLQYLIDGRTSAPEPLLVLNKILCGVPANTPIAREIEPANREREICEQLLRAMIENWKIISNTSIAGLQETFLRRDGRLERSGEGWKLRVQRKTVDVLVDQIPWSISIIYHRWMPGPLYVEW